jgi:ankyrin repeat protein
MNTIYEKIYEQVFQLIKEENLTDLKWFLKQRPHIHISQCQKLINGNIQTPVTLSVLLNNFEMLDFFTEKGCSLLDGNPLAMAISIGNKKIIDYLIEHSAKDENLLTQLIKSSQLDMFDYVIKKGIKEPRLLETAIILNRPKFMEYILSNQIETIYEVNKRNMNMLTVALEQDNEECVKILLDFGADPDDLSPSIFKNPWHQETLKEYEEIKRPYVEKKLLEKTINNTANSKAKNKL